MDNLSFFEKSVKIVNKYGTWKVLKSILLVGLFLVVILYIPAITKYTVEQTTMRTLENADKTREFAHIKSVERRRDTQPQVYSILESLLNSTFGDRAFIIELHNGSQNLNTVPFLHGSVTYERTREGVEGIDEEYQNISLSRYELASYLHNNFNFIGTIDELSKIDKKFAAKMAADDVAYVAVTTLHDGDREWGWFGVLYCNGTQIPEQTNILNELIISSQLISKILANEHS